MEHRRCTPFALPDHAPALPMSQEIVLSRSDYVKKPRLMDDRSYPFDRGIPDYAGHSCMPSESVTTLPIDASKAEIVDAVANSHITILTSETSSGKTSRAPQFVLDEYQRQGGLCRIVVAGQRRLGATSSARWVAEERQELHLFGDRGCTSVGYAVKDEAVAPWSWNSITYVTEQKLLNVFDRGYFTHIFIDEVHERTLNQDMLLMLCKKAIHVDPNRSFKVILMTATVDAAPLKEFFAAPLAATPCADLRLHATRSLVVREVNVPGRRFPVRRVFVNSASGVYYKPGDPPSQSVRDAVTWLFDTYGYGDVLVFVADVPEIRSCVEELKGMHDCVTHVLHSGCTHEERDGAMTRDYHQWKIIVATNIAETSLTIPGVRYVVTYPYERLPPGLSKVLVSKASLKQREGRAGRDEGEGVCLMMLSEADFGTLAEFRSPQAQRLPLRALGLFALERGHIANASSLSEFASGLPSPPDLGHVSEAIDDLEMYDLTKFGQLTFLGEVVAGLPFDIEIATALVTGVFLGVAHQLALVLAAATTPGFLTEFCQWNGAKKYAEYPPDSGELCVSDLYAAGCFLEWHMQWRANWTGSDRVLELAVSVVEDLRRHAASLNLSIDGDNSGWLWQNWPHVEFAFCSGFRRQVAVKSQGRKFKVRDGIELKLTQKSLVSEEQASAVFYVSRQNYFFTGLHVPSGLSLLAFGGCLMERRGNSVVFDDLLEMLCVSPVSEDLFQLRATLASKMCSFLQGCPNHANHAQTLKALLCCNNASPVTCLLYRPVVSVALTVPAPSDFAEAHRVARERCSHDLGPVSDCPPCIKGRHQPTKSRRGRALYELFKAVQDGCLTCVRRELELLTRVAPETFSDSNRWTVRDFAKDAAKRRQPGAREIQSYLDSYWSHLPVEP